MIGKAPLTTRSYATMSEALVGEAITRLSAWLSSFDADMHSRYHRPYSNPCELRDDIAVILDALIDRGEGNLPTRGVRP